MQRMFKAIFCDICRRVAFQEQLEGGFQDKVTRWKGGRKVERWELKDPAQKRNEAFDIRNYATAALEISNPPGLEIPGEDAPRPAKPQHQYRRRRSGGI